ncbi:MAG: diguanylate cyclase [Rhodocyclaceae bacterium]|nr:MAG: diguanylate cyclase [Rhodocyclaceae bacterium]
MPLWLLLLSVLFSLGAWSTWNAYSDYLQVIEQEYRLLEVCAREREARISGALRSVSLTLGSIIEDQQDRPTMSVTENNQLLRNYLRQLPELRNLLIEDATGVIRAEARETSIGLDASGRDYFKLHRDAPQNDEFHISRPFKAMNGVTATMLSRVMRDQQGQFAGVVLASLDAGFFADTLKLSAHESDLQAVLANLDGDILSLVPSSELVGKNLHGGIAFTEHVNSGEATTRHLNTVKLEHVEKMSVFHNLPGAPLMVIVSRDFDKVLEDWRQAMYAHAGSFLLLASAVLFFFGLAARRQRSLVGAHAQIVERELELRTIIETEPACVKQLSEDGTLLDMNRAGLAMIEADSLDQVVGHSILGWIRPEYRDAFTALTQRVFAGETGDLVFEIEGLKGGRRWLETHAAPLRNSRGQVTALLGVTRDITGRHQADAELRIAAAAFESQEGYVVTDANNIIKRINPSFTKITGYATEEVIGRNLDILKSGYHDSNFYSAMWQTILSKGAWRGEIMNRTKSGEIHPHAVAISAVKDDQGVTTHYVGGYTDITERKKMEEQVRQMAFHDTLTGLPNRRLLSDRLNQTMATTKRSGCYGALMFLDLDKFKPLNDTHGHAVGDLLLIELADRLRSCVREMDTVGRFGGDEFVVMLGELNASKDASTTQARIVAEKIRATLSQPYQLSVRQDGKADTTIEYRCTASIGVALFIDHQASEDDILKWADSAMYQAKEAGPNLIRFHAAKV